MAKYTKLLQFSKQTAQDICERDQGCIFCKNEYHMHCTSPMLYDIHDIMHYIPKSSMGLGIEKNGVLGCRYHHNLLDNGNKGLRIEMLETMKEHLQYHYPEWKEKDLTYKKWNF